MAGDPPRGENRALTLARTTAKFLVAWGAVHILFRMRFASDPLARFVDRVLEKVLGGFPAIYQYAVYFYDTCLWVFSRGGVTLVAAATMFAVLGALVRMVARARVRAGQGDFLDRARAFVREHAKKLSFVYAVPGLWWAVSDLWPGNWYREHVDVWLRDIGLSALPLALVGWAWFALLKKGVGELVAPTIAEGTKQDRFEIDANEISFDAVAVTRRSIALVALFTAVILAVPVFIATRSVSQLYHDVRLFYLAAGYMPFAVLGALAFRRASRISVGVDGVHVRGTSRARFVGYREIDTARANGADLELVRGGKVILRLQLHGEDAARRDAIIARIRENIGRIREGRSAAAAQMVATASTDEIARAAEGGADYRVATLTREQLWALVEGPEVAADARRNAAEALVRSSDDSERARLRVAADLCAQPEVRGALQAMVEEAEEGAGAGSALRAR